MPYLLPDGTLPLAQHKRVLVGCEFTGTVRKAFDKLGFDAYSCDLLPDVERSNKPMTVMFNLANPLTDDIYNSFK